jgi:hypothetical protein
MAAPAHSPSGRARARARAHTQRAHKAHAAATHLVSRIAPALAAPSWALSGSAQVPARLQLQQRAQVVVQADQVGPALEVGRLRHGGEPGLGAGWAVALRAAGAAVQVARFPGPCKVGGRQQVRLRSYRAAAAVGSAEWAAARAAAMWLPGTRHAAWLSRIECRYTQCRSAEAAGLLQVSMHTETAVVSSQPRHV